MKVLNFVEGANRQRGGLGLLHVPMIVKSLCDRGHLGTLLVGGRVNPGRERFVQPDVDRIMQEKGCTGKFGIVTFPAWGTWAFAPSMLWRVWRHVRDIDFVMLHSLYSFPVLAGYLLVRFFKKPYGLWPHGVLLPVQRHASVHKKSVYDRLIGRRILNQASVLFFTSKGERKDAHGLGLTPPSVVIPQGFDAQDFEPLPPRGQFRTKYLNGHSGPLVLYLSRLNAKKGLDLLAEAFSLVVNQVPDARLAIVGKGDPLNFESMVKNWLRQYGVEDNAVLPGLLTGREKLEAFADADVFAFPSEAENFGQAMFEAMGSGVPVVVSDTLDYATEVRRYEAGLVVRRDPQEFASAIVKLLRDSHLRKRMGENGARVARTYSWKGCGEKVERTIQCILQGKPLPVDLTLEK